jgi:predicted nucleic acid-binding protein
MGDIGRKARNRELTPEALELAVDGQASHIVTGDKNLLTLNPFPAFRS